jgi:hypothetical protein
MSINHPATVIVSGGTGSGKTVLTRAMLQHHRTCFNGMAAHPRVLWCYGIYQVLYGVQVPNVNIAYREGLAPLSMIEQSKPDVIVVDDLIDHASSEHLQNLFVRASHHLNVTVIYITQNLYEKGQVKLKRNAHYIFMMRNPSDKSQITTLGRQLYPRQKKLLDHFYEAYDDATSQRYGYLMIDVSPQSDETQKLKTNILPDKSGEVRAIVYVPK